MRPGGGRRVEPALAPEKRGPTLVGRTGGTLRPRPGVMKMLVVKILPAMEIAEKLVELPAVGVLITGWYISDRNSN